MGNLVLTRKQGESFTLTKGDDRYIIYVSRIGSKSSFVVEFPDGECKFASFEPKKILKVADGEFTWKFDPNNRGQIRVALNFPQDYSIARTELLK
jgi:sRNA-binding carbon storage regulator CsrA